MITAAPPDDRCRPPAYRYHPDPQIIAVALRMTGAALQVIGITLIFDIPSQMIATAIRLTGAAIQLRETTLIFGIPPLR